MHYGADDNASGSAAVLAVGEALSQAAARRRNVLLEFWSGEEIGLIGSTAYVNAPPVPIDQLAAYFNFDMVGRMQDNKLTVQATGTSEAWARLIEQANVAAGFDLLVQADPYQPTDVASFNQAGVPSLNFFTGTHTDYHRPSDTADKIDYEDLDRIVAFAAAIARRVGNADARPGVHEGASRQPQGGARAGVRVFTGTIPDYSTEVKGLLLSGVIDGGPAAQAGLQKGDVIVEIAGQTIANIYDYTYALEVLKIGEPAKVVYMRGTRAQGNDAHARREKVGGKRSRDRGSSCATDRRRAHNDRPARVAGPPGQLICDEKRPAPTATAPATRRRPDGYSGRTFEARGPFGDCSSSKLTRCPSFRLSKLPCTELR